MSLTAELVQLAKEPSSDKRRALLRQITDLFFLDDGERNISETTLFEEVVSRVWGWLMDPGHECRALVAEGEDGIVAIGHHRRFSRPFQAPR